jgi:hypothetical protein
MQKLPRTVVILVPDEINNQLHAMPTPYIGSCMKSYCISNPGHSIQTATHTQEFHKMYMFVSTQSQKRLMCLVLLHGKTVTSCHHTRTQQKGILILMFTHRMVSRMSIKCVCTFEVKRSDILHTNFTVAWWHYFKTNFL